MSFAHSRFRAAVHALAVIAYLPDKQATSDAIAKSVNTDPTVIRRLLARLAESGLVQGSTGRAGGYSLGRPAKSISLRDVFLAVGSDELFPQSDRTPNAGCPVGSTIRTVLDQPLEEARFQLEQSLAQTTLADVVKTISAR